MRDFPKRVSPSSPSNRNLLKEKGLRQKVFNVFLSPASSPFAVLPALNGEKYPKRGMKAIKKNVKPPPQ